MKINFFVLILFSCFINPINQIKSQACTPASADNCADANVLCSLDEVNGYTCQNVDYSNPTACLGGGTSCPNGIPHNSGWWAFVTNGGFVSITVTFANCVNSQGVQIGVVGSCDCSGQVSCNSNCSAGGSSITISGNLAPCKTYYLWVDGCNGDVCTFSLSTSGGASPKLANFTLSRTGPNPICKGCCADFMVTPQPSLCEPDYVWTIDGFEIKSGPEERVNLCFPDEGTFSVCVQAVIGNPSSGSICDELTKCMNVTVAKKQDEIAKPRIYCPEKLPVQWHCQSISGPGEYRCPFTINGCCEYDSVITIDEVTVQEGPEIWYVGCQGQPYIDPTTGASYGTCLNHEEIFLRGKSRPYGCDSSYFLSLIFPSSQTEISLSCQNSTVKLKANPKITTELCGQNIELSVSYVWYERQNPNKVIGNDLELLVSKNSNYCFSHILNYKLGDQSKVCTFDVCENFDELNIVKYLENIKLGTITKACDNDTIDYYLENFPSKVLKYNWEINGGQILNLKPDSSSRVSVIWQKNNSSICLSIETECGKSKKVCTTNVDFGKVIAQAGNDTVMRCDQNSIMLNGSNSLFLVNAFIKWTSLQGSRIDNNNSLNPIIYNPGIYILKITKNNGCEYSDTVVVFPAKEIENISYKVKNVDCPIDKNGELYDIIIKGGTMPFKFFLNGKIFSNRVDKLIVGNYKLEVIDSLGCKASIDNVEVKSNSEIYSIKLNASKNIILPNEDFDIELLSSKNLFNSTIVWHTDNLAIEKLIPCNKCLEWSNVNIYKSTCFWVEVYDSLNCLNSDKLCLSINENELPDMITPNNDGKNDFLYIYRIQTGEWQNIQLIVVDRYGREVFSQMPYLNNWKGTWKSLDGDLLPNGGYYYALLSKGTVLYKSALTILR